MSAVPLTCRSVTAPPKPCLTPSQRFWRPMLFCSWMTHRTFLTPSCLKRAPAALPAIASSCPTCVIAPSSLNWSAPELSVTIGMPAALALASEAVALLRDRGVDQLRLLLRVVVGGAPDELDALVLGGLLGALLDHRPER